MKHFIRFISLLALPLLLVTMPSCSSEDDLEPTYADYNGFEPLDSDQSATAQLRRAFYNATGAYLLFTDTLVTKSTNGQPELLSPYYGILGTSSSLQSSYTYKYVTDVATQKQYADLTTEYMAKRLGKSVPNAFMLVDEISYLNSYGNKRTVTQVLGTRAYVLSMGNGEVLDDPKAWFDNMFMSIVSDLIGRASDATMEPFYAFSSEYYGSDLEDFGWESLTQQETWDLGFFRYYDSWGVYFPYKSGDLSAWIEAVVTMSPEEFEAEYGSSATMVNKYNTLRDIIAEMGIQL